MSFCCEKLIFPQKIKIKLNKKDRNFFLNMYLESEYLFSAF
jgi:hypothetical protein